MTTFKFNLGAQVLSIGGQRKGAIGTVVEQLTNVAGQPRYKVDFPGAKRTYKYEKFLVLHKPVKAEELEQANIKLQQRVIEMEVRVAKLERVIRAFERGIKMA